MNNAAVVIRNNTLERFDDTVDSVLIIPDHVTAIAATAFEGCCRLKELTIPKSVTDIEPGAFDDCTNLSVINVPDNFDLIEVSELYNTKWYKEHRDGLVILGTLLLEYNGTESEITVPAGVTRIVERVFSSVSFSAVVRLPSTVMVIEDGAFNRLCEPIVILYDV